MPPPSQPLLPKRQALFEACVPSLKINSPNRAGRFLSRSSLNTFVGRPLGGPWGHGKKAGGERSRPSARTAQTHSSGAEREVDHADPRPEEAFGRAPRGGGGQPQVGAGLELRREAEPLRRARAAITPDPPTPHPGASLRPEELPDRLERPLRASPPSQVRRESGSPVPKAYPHPLRTSRVLRSRPVTPGGGRRGARAAEPPNPGGPGSRRAP